MNSFFPEIHISLEKQELKLETAKNIFYYDIATAANGSGQKNGSGCTPLGNHYICAKFGDSVPVNTVFVGRRETGEIFTADLSRKYAQRDWILTRILWLSGLDKGYNLGGENDSRSRFIYIHGCPDSIQMGTPNSGGCIRMKNQDVICLYDKVSVGSLVSITQ